MNYFRENLKYLREFKELTQEMLAKHLGVNRSSISNWEKGYSMPSVDEIINIANYFSIELGMFLTSRVEHSNESGIDDYIVVRKDCNLLVLELAQASQPFEWSQGIIENKLRAVVIPGITGEARTFEIVGDSMEPALYHGDWISCTRVMALDNIRGATVYAIITSSMGITVKYLQRHPNGLKCVSHNKTENPPFIIPHEEIVQLWEARLRITSHIITPF